jgi:integrase
MGRKATTASLSPKSGKELAKASARKKPAQKASRTTVIYGKGTAKYWEGRVYRPVWSDDDGQRRKVSNYFARVMVGGRREAVALNTADRLEAAQRAASLYAKIRAVGWEAALRDFDPERHTPRSDVTVEDAVKAIGRADLRPKTRAAYVGALRWFAARHVGFRTTKKTFGPKGAAEYQQKVQGVKLGDLSVENVRPLIERHIQSAGGDAAAERSARISVASFIRNAKAALKVAEGQGLKLPEPRPFSGVAKPEGATAPGYTSTFDPARLLREAREELAPDPPAYIPILLAVGAGLRHGEIENLCWRRVDAQGKRVLVQATGGWKPKTGESEQSVHVSDSLLEELGRFRAKLDDPVTTPAGLDRAIGWLRRKGLDMDKPLHQLRREFGSIIAQEADLFTASKALRHSSLAVTASVYVEHRKRVAPDIKAMLATPTTAKKT